MVRYTLHRVENVCHAQKIIYYHIADSYDDQRLLQANGFRGHFKEDQRVVLHGH
jgi:hypothetical protein